MATSNSIRRGSRSTDITGQTFGNWTVLTFHSTDKYRAAMWLCQCKCGATQPVKGGSLRSGASTQCRRCARQTHGRSNTPEWQAWSSMLRRCLKADDGHYVRYQGRGITVCRGWRCFETFIVDMGLRPSSKHSIDRIENDGHYSCGHCEECLMNGWSANCRWATHQEQNRNSSGNTRLTYGGRTMCAIEWAEEMRMSYNALLSRLALGWPIDRALTTPVRPRRKCR